MPKTESHKHLEVHFFANSRAWLRWLGKHHEQPQGVWIKFAKKNSGIQSLTYEEGREGAIMFGWIDGLINRFDESFYLTKFTPRRSKSRWSKINREIAEGLARSGKMKPPGTEQVQAAMQDGRWEAAYDSPATIQAPRELKKLINSNKIAKANFENLSSTNRYAFLYRIQNVKLAATKQKHIERTFEMLKRGEVYHPEATKSSFRTKAARKKK